MRTLSAELLEIQAHPDALASVTVRCKRRSTFTGDPLLWRPIFKHTAANLPYADVNVTAGNTLTLNSPVAGTGTFIKGDAGTLEFDPSVDGSARGGQFQSGKTPHAPGDGRYFDSALAQLAGGRRGG